MNGKELVWVDGGHKLQHQKPGLQQYATTASDSLRLKINLLCFAQSCSEFISVTKCTDQAKIVQQTISSLTQKL